MRNFSFVSRTVSHPHERISSRTVMTTSLSATSSSAAAPSAWARVSPIIFFVVYLNLTVFLFAFGPWEYPVDNGHGLYLFLALAHLALLFGYLTAAFREPMGYSGIWTTRGLMQVSALLSLVVLLPTSRFRTGQIIPDVIGGLTDPGEAYAWSQLLRDTGEPFIEYIRILIGPLLAMVLPLTVFYWERLSLKLRFLGVASIVGTVAMFIAMGTNKAFADTVLLVPWLILAAHLAGTNQLRWRHKLAFSVGGLITVVAFLAYFEVAVSARTGSIVAAGYFAATKTHVDEDNFLVRHLSPPVAATLKGLDVYVTHGYYALSLSLKEPFVPTFGVGNSMFLSRQAARLIGNRKILDMSYPVRIEKYGWDAQALWSSIYPWIASDVSFPGTLLIVFLIGRGFALCWLDTLRGENPFAVVLLSQFLIMLFYFPANNQLLQSGEGFIAFWVTLLLWWRTRRSGVTCRARVVATSS